MASLVLIHRFNVFFEPARGVAVPSWHQIDLHNTACRPGRSPAPRDVADISMLLSESLPYGARQ